MILALLVVLALDCQVVYDEVLQECIVICSEEARV